MTPEIAQFTNRGMNQDISVSKATNEFAFENYNIRITAVNDNTLLSITNEKLPLKLEVSVKGYKETTTYNYILGQYLGHAVLNNKLVLFTKSEYDYITVLQLTEDKFIGEIKYKGDLNFSLQHPIETLSYYESEDIQKVYWTDGYNPLRVINIESDNIIEDFNTQFDFNPSINKYPTISIEKEHNTLGLFPSGVIQYFVSYYNKYGQETGIVYQSPLYYISDDKKGLSPEDTSTCNFKITLRNLDTNYEFVRVYSLIRTSQNTTPVCSIVKDVEINSNKVVVIDTNQKNTIVDSTMLLFLGGDNFTASTLTQKDDVLFVGDISQENIILDSDVKTALLAECFEQGDDYTSQIVSFDTKVIPLTDQLDRGENIFKTFKCGERYRFALQFQDAKSNWTTPVWIGDKTCDVYPNTSFGGVSTTVASAKVSLPQDVLDVIGDKYVRYRLLIAEPTYADRKILAQGIVNPTVFNYEHRINQSGPYAQASWILRPQKGNTVYSHLIGLGNSKYLEDGTEKFKNLNTAEIQNSINEPPLVVSGAASDNKGYILCFTANSGGNTEYNVWPAYLENSRPTIDFSDTSKSAKNGSIEVAKNNERATFLITEFKKYFSNIKITENELLTYLNAALDRTPTYYEEEADINNYWKVGYPTPVPNIAEGGFNTVYSYNTTTRPIKATGYVFIADSNGVSTVVDKKETTNYYVDSNIVTFHSPDIDAIKDVVNEKSLTFEIVGIVPINSERTDVEINTKTSGYSGTSSTKLSYAKTFVNNHIFEDYGWTGNNKIDNSKIVQYYNYLWQKDGSIIGQTNSSVDENNNKLTQTYADLSTKIFGYFKKSNYTKYRDYTAESKLKYNVIPKVFSDTDLITTTIDSKNTNNYYQGNCNFVSTVSGKATYRVFWNDGTTQYWYNINQKQQSPVSIKYKTKPHLVFSLNKNSKSHVLPDFYDVSDQGAYRSYIEKFLNFYSEDITEGDLNNLKLPWTKETLTNSYYQTSLDGAGTPFETASGKYLYIGEIKRDIEDDVIYGGKDDYSLQRLNWIPASNAVSIRATISNTFGDTYYQRWNFVHSVPFTREDQNSVVDSLSFMVETHINLEGDYSKVNPEDNTLNVDYDNVGKINPVYSQNNNYFSYNILDEKFNNEAVYNNQVAFSLVKTPTEITDTWCNISLASAFNLNGLYGKLNKLATINDSIIAFQDKALSVINFNNRTALSTESGVPIEIANSGKVNGYSILSSNIGCQNKNSICFADSGVYFVDNYNKALYNFNKEGISEVSSKGMSLWFKDNLTGNEHTMYDSINNDVYINTGNIVIVFNEGLQSFTSLMDYSKYIGLFNIEDKPFFLNPRDREYGITFNKLFEGEYTNDYYIKYKINPEPLIDKTFGNIEYIADLIYNNKTIDAEPTITNKSVTNPFNMLEVWNEYQYGYTNNLSKFKYPNFENKFRIWRADIPRDNKSNKLNRIRNPWIYLKLSNTNNHTDKMVFHNLLVKYYK